MNWILTFGLAVGGIAFIWLFFSALVGILAWVAAAAAAAGIVYVLLKKSPQ